MLLTPPSFLCPSPLPPPPLPLPPLPPPPLPTAKDGVQARSTATLAAYRKHCAATSSAVQLILPEALKLLPLYALALLKSPGFRPDARPDDRALFLNALLTAAPARTMGLLHARMYPLHRLLVNPVNGGQSSLLPPAPLLPEPLALSSESLEEGGVFLVDSGRDLLVFVDGDAPPQLLQVGRGGWVGGGGGAGGGGFVWGQLLVVFVDGDMPPQLLQVRGRGEKGDEGGGAQQGVVMVQLLLVFVDGDAPPQLQQVRGGWRGAAGGGGVCKQAWCGDN